MNLFGKMTPEACVPILEFKKQQLVSASLMGFVLRWNIVSYYSKVYIWIRYLK